MSGSGVGLASRLARRQVRRRPWRTLLVALLVAGPVAGMTVAVVLVRSNQLSAIEEWRLDNGAADALLGGDSTPGDVPPGSRWVSFQTDRRLVRTVAGRATNAEVTNLPLADPIARDIVIIDPGRPPARPDEVVLSRRTATALGVGVGDTLDLERPVAGRFTVVGIGERGSVSSGDLLVVHSDLPFPVRPGDQIRSYRLVVLAEDLSPAALQAWAQVPGKALAPGLVPYIAADAVGDEAEPIAWSWFAGAVALTVLGIVIASAFAAGARRQLETLGQLAANGASPRILRRVLMLEGTWTGLVGAVAGLALGGGALIALAPYRDRILSRHVSAYDVRMGDLGPIVVLGVLAATVAALVPARTAGRVPVLAALAGRRPLGSVPLWLTVGGVIAAGAGVALMALATLGATGRDGGDSAMAVWVLTGTAGGVALLLGACAAAPGYVSVLGPAASRLRGPWRLAARSLARQRTRTGAAVSAICATGALALAASAILNSAAAAASARTEMAGDSVVVSARFNRSAVQADGVPRPAVIEPPPGEVVDRLRGVLAGAEAIPLSWVALDPDGGRIAAVADAALVDAYRFGSDVRGALERAGAVVLAEGDGTRQVVVEVSGRPAVTLAVPTVQRSSGSFGVLPTVLIAPEQASELGLDPRPGDLLLRQGDELTAAEREAVGGVLDEIIDDQARRRPSESLPRPSISVDLRRPASAADPLALDAALGGIAVVFTLFVVATSLALASAETRDERDILSMVGASPRTIRRTSGVKAVVLTALGALLALPVGLLPVLVFTHVSLDGPSFVLPWRVVVLLVVGLPALAGLVTASSSALVLRWRPVTASTMAH